jgi:hypothetical protein
MKETNKILTVYLLIIFIVIACTKVEIPAPHVIDLGKVSTSTAIVSLSTALIKDKVDVTMSLTPGAKYSLRLIDLNNDVKKSVGFTADNTLVVKTLDYSDVKTGDYTLELIDISGKEYKRLITIKH